MTTDPIADMLTRIRNAASASRAETVMPYSKMKEQIARILKEAGFIIDFTVSGAEQKVLQVRLSEEEVNHRTVSLVRVSKPGRRIYAGSQEIPSVLGGRGIVIISTSGGIMTGAEARKRGLGGELICKVW
jgi:small subunit ribosomal protein S8